MLKEKIKEKIYGRLEACENSLKYTIESLCETQGVLRNLTFLMRILELKDE